MGGRGAGGVTLDRRVTDGRGRSRKPIALIPETVSGAALEVTSGSNVIANAADDDAEARALSEALAAAI